MSDHKAVPLDELCKESPDWAATHIRHLREDLGARELASVADRTESARLRRERNGSRKRVDELEMSSAAIANELREAAAREAGLDAHVEKLESAFRTERRAHHAHESGQAALQRRVKELEVENKALGAAEGRTQSDRLCRAQRAHEAEQAALKRRINQLEAECFALSAGVCPVEGGLVGSDCGTPCCTLERQIGELEAEIKLLVEDSTQLEQRQAEDDQH